MVLKDVTISWCSTPFFDLWSALVCQRHHVSAASSRHCHCTVSWSRPSCHRVHLGGSGQVSHISRLLAPDLTSCTVLLAVPFQRARKDCMMFSRHFIFCFMRSRIYRINLISASNSLKDNRFCLERAPDSESDNVRVVHKSSTTNLDRELPVKSPACSKTKVFGRLGSWFDLTEASRITRAWLVAPSPKVARLWPTLVGFSWIRQLAKSRLWTVPSVVFDARVKLTSSNGDRGGHRRRRHGEMDWATHGTLRSR